MKYIYIILICIISGGVYSQSPSIPFILTDSITVPTSTIINAAQRIKIQQDSLNRQHELISELARRIELQERMNAQTAIELELLYSRVEISDGIVDRYQQYIRREEWYDKTWVHVGMGFVGALGVSIIVSNITR